MGDTSALPYPRNRFEKRRGGAALQNASDALKHGHVLECGSVLPLLGHAQRTA